MIKLSLFLNMKIVISSKIRKNTQHKVGYAHFSTKTC